MDVAIVWSGNLEGDDDEHEASLLFRSGKSIETNGVRANLLSSFDESLPSFRSLKMGLLYRTAIGERLAIGSNLSSACH